MRILITVLAAALLASPLTPGVQAKEVSVEFFYDSLDPYGEWIQTEDYGFVWHPKEVSEDWRPYTDGSWAYTDAGWTWVSEEPYGAIVYHYGRWTRLQDAGWVWVPDTEWAPAWVSWRRSEQYVGWAPLPPEATFQREVGISSWADSYYDIGPSNYTFVSVRDFGAPQLTKVVLPRRQNTKIITETRNITNISYSSGVIYNDGPQYTVISRESRLPVRRLRLERRDDVVFEGNRVRGDVLRSSIAGDALRVFAPAVAYRTDLRPQRIGRTVQRVEVDRGWRDVPQAQDLRARIQQDTPRRPELLPERPRFTRATTALGLSDNEERRRNLDPEGRPRLDRESRSATVGTTTESRSPASTATTETTRPGDRPAATARENMRPGDRPRAGTEATRPGERPSTTATDSPRPGDRPPTATADTAKPGDRPPSTASEAAPDGRKRATAETKAGKGRPGATPEAAAGAPRSARDGTDPGAPDAPRTGRSGPNATTGPDATASARDGAKPTATTRPEGAPEGRPGAPRTTREGTDPGAPDAPRTGKPGADRTTGPNTTAPGRDGAKPSATGRPQGAPEGRDAKPGATRTTREGTDPAAPDAPRSGRGGPDKTTGPNATAAGRDGAKPSTTGRPEGAPDREGKPDAARGSKESRPDGGRPESARPESARPDADRPGGSRPGADRPGADRPGSREPKASAAGGGESARPRKEDRAPEGARRPEGNPPGRESAAPAGRPAAPAGAPAAEAKGKKGDDKDKDKDKDKGR